jgi:hypothetical protein
LLFWQLWLFLDLKYLLNCQLIALFVELSEEEVRRRMKIITPELDPNWAGVPQPFDAANPPPKV